MTMAQRLSCLDARPEVASLNLTPDMSKFRMKAREAPLPHPRPEMEYDDCIPFSYKLVGTFAREMKSRGIKPEIETYPIPEVRGSSATLSSNTWSRNRI